MNVLYCSQCSVRIDPEDLDDEGLRYCAKCAAEMLGTSTAERRRQLSTRRLKPVTRTQLAAVSPPQLTPATGKSHARLRAQKLASSREKAQTPPRSRSYWYIGLIAVGLGLCGAFFLFSQPQAAAFKTAPQQTARAINR